jgi:hypothetical protein
MNRIKLSLFLLLSICLIEAKPPASTPSSQTTGGNPQNSNTSSQNSPGQSQAGQQPATPSAEATILVYNHLIHIAADIASAESHFVAGKTLLILNESDAATFAAPNPVLQSVSLYNTNAANLIKNIANDLAKLQSAAAEATGTSQKATPVSLDIGWPRGGSSFSDIQTLISAISAGLPTISETPSTIFQDSNPLELQVARDLRVSAAHIFMPGLFPFSASMGDATPGTSDIEAALNKAQAAFTQLQNAANLLAKDAGNPANPPATTPPDGGTAARIKVWNDNPEIANDLSLANSWVKAFPTLTSTLNTPDSTGNTPFQEAAALANGTRLIANSDYTLVVRIVTSIGTEITDRGAFNYHHWLLPLPHNEFYYSGVCVGEYALLDKFGAVVDAGIISSGTSQLSKSDFLWRFDKYPHTKDGTRVRDAGQQAGNKNPLDDRDFFKQ